MARAGRWLRSLLFVPGHKLDWMRKAPKYGADALIFDLEDAVPVGEKGAARQRIVDVLQELPPGDPFVFVRVNGWDSGALLDDVLAVVGERLDGIVQAKVRSPLDVAALDLVLTSVERTRRIEPGGLEILPLTETASATAQFADVCAASPRIVRVAGVSGLTPGAPGDLHRALGLEPRDDGLELLYTSGQAVVAARAAGIEQILGGMTLAIDDHDLARRSLTRARQLGATGSIAIHPSVIPVIHDVFTPSNTEIAEAIAIVEAVAAAVARGDGVAVHRGMMVDAAHAKSSYVVLARAAAGKVALPPYPDPGQLGLDSPR